MTESTDMVTFGRSDDERAGIVKAQVAPLDGDTQFVVTDAGLRELGVLPITECYEISDDFAEKAAANGPNPHYEPMPTEHYDLRIENEKLRADIGALRSDQALLRQQLKELGDRVVHAALSTAKPITTGAVKIKSTSTRDGSSEVEDPASRKAMAAARSRRYRANKKARQPGAKA